MYLFVTWVRQPQPVSSFVDYGRTRRYTAFGFYVPVRVMDEYTRFGATGISNDATLLQLYFCFFFLATLRSTFAPTFCKKVVSIWRCAGCLLAHLSFLEREKAPIVCNAIGKRK